MTDVDDLIQQRSQAALEPGEHVLGSGLVFDKDPHSGILAFLGCATDRRLMLFDSDYKIGWSVGAVAQAGELTEWRYGDLAEVRQQKGDHHFLRLAPHAGRGPFPPEPGAAAWRRYEIPFKVKNFDSHAKFVADYPCWLEAQFRSGALAHAPGSSASAGSVEPPPVGAQVLVTWSDGNRYPGTVIEVQGQHAHVHMQGGQPLWVELRVLGAWS